MQIHTEQGWIIWAGHTSICLALADMLTLCHKLAQVSSQSYHVNCQSWCPVTAITILRITLFVLLPVKTATDRAISNLQAPMVFNSYYFY